MTHSEHYEGDEKQVKYVDLENRADTREMLFFSHPNLLGLMSPVVKVKLLFWTGSIILQIMCMSDRSLSNLQVKL